jgi:hypothetical protein
MGDALETSAQRVRDHLRRPVPGSRNLLMETAGNTVSAIDPAFRALSSIFADEDSIDRMSIRPLNIRHSAESRTQRGMTGRCGHGLPT